MPWIKSCLCHQEKKRTPVISPPIQLLLKPEGNNSVGAGHAFRCKVFKKPRPCHLCHQPIFNQGSCCRVCKYVCHKVCESKEAADRFTDTSWKIHRQWQKSNSLPGSTISERTITNSEINRNDPPVGGANNNNDVYATIKTNATNSTNATSTTMRRKVVEIQTVQTTLERKKPPCNGDIILHTHEEAKNGNRNNKTQVITSNYQQQNVFTDALTSQPRRKKSSSNKGGGGDGMDLSYVTERIIALWFPATCSAQVFRRGHRQASHMLINKHGDNYKVFNLSEPRAALLNEHKHVEEVGWSARLAPPLERLCSVCKQIDSWLSTDQHRIAVIHARGGKDKLGVVVASYMHYSNICGSADQALDRFSMRKFLDDNIGPLYLPSNKRYVAYFAGLLSHSIKINSAPLYLTHVTVLGAPAYQNNGCRAFLKLYEGQTPIYTSGIYSVSSGVSQFTVNVAGERRRGLQLRGDILIKCYHHAEFDRETIFACQFHTCAVSDNTLSFTRQDLDGASNDPRFPIDGAIELHFSPGPESRHPGPAPTPAVPVTMNDDRITRADSPFEGDESEEDEDTDSDDVNHTFGPLDGSIYATIAKKQELSPGAVSSPLTVSMDSGISSAGHQQHANTNASTSPPLTGQPSPLSPEDQHRELDELLSDMMLTVQNIPDLKPQPIPTENTNDLENVRYIDEEEDKNIPYHARQDSRPFSYGVNNTMIGDTKKLSSPSLVRKASFNKSQGNTLNKVQTQVYPQYGSNTFNNNNNSQKSGYNTYNGSGGDAIDNIFTSKALAANYRQEPQVKQSLREEFYSVRTKEPVKKSYTDSTLRTNGDNVSSLKSTHYSNSESWSSPSAFRTSGKFSDSQQCETYSTNSSNLTWLQKQQMKLKERREMQRKEERQPYQHSLMTELRSVQNRHLRQSASHRQDGYTSDTTAFADDDEDFTIPLHINTKQSAMSPSSTSSYSTKSNYTNGRTERPFVALRKEYAKSTSSSSPENALAAHPLGHVVRAPSRSGDVSARQDASGLLSLANQAANKDGNNITNPVGIVHVPRANDEIHPRIAVLSDLMANLSNGANNLYNGSTNNSSSAWQYQDDYSTWRSTEVDSSSPHSVSSRPQTPAFPVARTPYANSSTPTVQFDLPGERLPPKSPTTVSYSPKSQNGSSSPSIYQGTSRRGSISSNEPTQEVSPIHVKFVSDSSKFWYKPTITRDEAINMLRDKPPGTFVVRNSNTFAGGFGMALKVAMAPAAAANKEELVRHFLIEPTSRGVRIKGCPNEPVFTSLSALVYQHSITQIALPCRLLLPENDIAPVDAISTQTQMLLVQGAACNVYYLLSIDMESLTGPQAVRKAVFNLLKMKKPEAKIVHFKVNKQGITLTDNKRELFFRKHYPINSISHCGLDPDDNRWNATTVDTQHPSRKIFGFVARKPTSNSDNQCHLFADMDPDQPASAIVSFVNKVFSSISMKQNIV
ncbi:tensin-1 isoform X5 [Atheta coriaria]|uniref:tensin-1 isoform X5 n=1 Tax=Dalotia coriaria TaxID=877792 RepID=UPI0031F41890